MIACTDTDVYEELYTNVAENIVPTPPGMNGTVKLVASALDNVGNRQTVTDAMVFEVVIEALPGICYFDK